MGSQLVEEWARSKLVNFRTGEVILAHHFVLLLLISLLHPAIWAYKENTDKLERIQ